MANKQFPKGQDIVTSLVSREVNGARRDAAVAKVLIRLRRPNYSHWISRFSFIVGTV